MLDRAKVEEARSYSDATTTSDIVELALDAFIERARLDHDVAAYARVPRTAAERAITTMPLAFDLGDDEVDYEAIHGSSG